MSATQQSDITERVLGSRSLLRQAHSCKVFYGRYSPNAERPNSRLQSNGERRPFFFVDRGRFLVSTKIYLPPQYDRQLFVWHHFLYQSTLVKKPARQTKIIKSKYRRRRTDENL